MGRNAIPKLEEWRDGKLYRFRAVSSFGSNNGKTPTADDGRLIVFECVTRHKGNETTETLATAYADGLLEVMAAMWQSGFMKGVKEGERRKAEEVRKVLLADHR